MEMMKDVVDKRNIRTFDIDRMLYEYMRESLRNLHRTGEPVRAGDPVISDLHSAYESIQNFRRENNERLGR